MDQTAEANDMDATRLWERYKRHYCTAPSIGLGLDISRMSFGEAFLAEMEGPMLRAFDEMALLEAGGIANPDESRQVGHYWLRAPALSPDDETRDAISKSVTRIKTFAAAVHEGSIQPASGGRFEHLLLVGIGGSALGPQFVTDALGGPNDAMRAWFCDNTDPDGIDRTVSRIGVDLNRTLTVVISKSGRTVETRNGMLEVRRAYELAGLSFEKCAVAITQEGSALDSIAEADEWLARFPMWDWVGGRTSELSAVGLLPAALQGYDIDEMLAGAARCDEVTRERRTGHNPAALMALMWYHAGGGIGKKAMVVLPYKDRLSLFSKYLQQLVMESLGKRLDRDGAEVYQGITVYGNKGSTDQHAYVQQLRDGLNDFFVMFVEVLRDRAGESMPVEEDVTSGDYLRGFFLGTRNALWDAERESVTITIDDVSARSVGVLIALFERAVGLYASLVNVNAYHQPGVEAGKKAASDAVTLQRDLLVAMRRANGDRRTADAWAESMSRPQDAETVFKTLEHLAANGAYGVSRDDADGVFDASYGVT